MGGACHRHSQGSAHAARLAHAGPPCHSRAGPCPAPCLSLCTAQSCPVLAPPCTASCLAPAQALPCEVLQGDALCIMATAALLDLHCSTQAKRLRSADMCGQGKADKLGSMSKYLVKGCKQHELERTPQRWSCHGLAALAAAWHNPLEGCGAQPRELVCCGCRAWCPLVQSGLPAWLQHHPAGQVVSATSPGCTARQSPACHAPEALLLSDNLARLVLQL